MTLFLSFVLAVSPISSNDTAFPIAVAVTAPRNACAFHHRQRVRLRGLADELRPWLWFANPAIDRLTGLEALQANQDGKGSDNFIEYHTKVLEQDTIAVVTSACPGGDERIIGVHVLTGFHAGADGFVDVRDAAYPPK